jgi:uncharacterized membrane protein
MPRAGQRATKTTLPVEEITVNTLVPDFLNAYDTCMKAYDIILRVTLVIVSGIGLYSCFCFAQEYLAKYLPSLKKVKPVEAVCKDGSCIMLEKTHWGRLLGVPNWWLGTVFYILVILSTIWTNMWIITFAILGTLGACLFSVILIYGLVFKLKAFCKMCYIAHAANFAIFILWVIAVWQATTHPY